MRLLGIDYGSKRIGIAISDEGAQFAMPQTVINNSNNLALSRVPIKEIIEIARKNNIKEIVMGESKNYKGEANTILPESLNFKMDLEKEGFID